MPCPAPRHVTRHRYHDGYYDPVEREFRGFGFVESWDSDALEPVRQSRGRRSGAGHAPRPTTSSRRRSIPGRGTGRGWRALAGLDRAWRGDPLAPALDPARLDPGLSASDPETLRQAYVALTGRMIRHEAYGLDASPDAATPFSVTDASSGPADAPAPRGQSLCGLPRLVGRDPGLSL